MLLSEIQLYLVNNVVYLEYIYNPSRFPTIIQGKKFVLESILKVIGFKKDSLRDAAQRIKYI